MQRIGSGGYCLSRRVGRSDSDFSVWISGPGTRVQPDGISMVTAAAGLKSRSDGGAGRSAISAAPITTFGDLVDPDGWHEKTSGPDHWVCLSTILLD